MKNRNNQLTIYLLLACIIYFYLIIAALVFSSGPYVPSSAGAAWPYFPVVEIFLGTIIISYLLGSLPFGLWVTNAFAGKDVRQIGSGKIGMTNVMRAAGKKVAAFSLFLDISKSALAVLSAHLIFSSSFAGSIGATNLTREIAMVLAAFAAIAGHTWSIFLKFKGGRGVGTFIGGLLVMYWQAGVVGGGLMILIGMRTKYMSMGSIIGSVTAFIMLMSFSILQIQFFGPLSRFRLCALLHDRCHLHLCCAQGQRGSSFQRHRT
jgi:acyl phosphate:glycerol-3-phosphate acyltransferase